MYDSVLVIVCRITEYAIPLLCSSSLTSSEPASLFLGRFVTFFGLPKDTFTTCIKLCMQMFFPHSVSSQELRSIDPLCVVETLMVGLSGQSR